MCRDSDSDGNTLTTQSLKHDLTGQQRVHWAMQLHNELQRQGRLRSLSWDDQVEGPSNNAVWTSTVFCESFGWDNPPPFPLTFSVSCALSQTCYQKLFLTWPLSAYSGRDRVWERNCVYSSRSTWYRGQEGFAGPGAGVVRSRQWSSLLRYRADWQILRVDIEEWIPTAIPAVLFGLKTRCQRLLLSTRTCLR